jgi:hypothetical protein
LCDLSAPTLQPYLQHLCIYDFVLIGASFGGIWELFYVQ